MVQMFGGKKQKLVFLQKRKDAYYLHSEKMVNVDSDVYKEGKKAYRIDHERTAWDNGPIFFDVDNCEAIVFEKLTSKKNPKDLESYMQSTALSRLVQGHLLKIMLIAVGLMALGIIITGAWGIYNLNVANKQLADITLKYMNATTGGLIH
jgi:hypothetical protein